MRQTFLRNSGGVPPGNRATIFIACSHWLKSDAVFNVGVLDVDILLLLKLFLRVVDWVDDRGLDADGEIGFGIDSADFASSSSSSSSSADEVDVKIPNFMSSNCARWILSVIGQQLNWRNYIIFRKCIESNEAMNIKPVHGKNNYIWMRISFVSWLSQPVTCVSFCEELGATAAHLLLIVNKLIVWINGVIWKSRAIRFHLGWLIGRGRDRNYCQPYNQIRQSYHAKIEIEHISMYRNNIEMMI